MQTKIGSRLEVRFVLSIIVLVALAAPSTFAAAGFQPSPSAPALSQKSTAPANPAVVETPSALSYTSYLLSPADRINAVAAGADGTLYVAGVRLPSVVAVDPTQRSAGEGKAFVARFSTDGSRLLYFTYVDSSRLSEARAIAVDAAGNAYVTGETHAENFPVRNPLQPECGQDTSGRCSGDAFVAKLDVHGTILFSTYFGGSGKDAGNAIALDAQGNIYLAGSTDSTDLPILKPVQSASAGNGDAFVAEIAADGSRVLFATYLGGTGADQARGIALDKKGNIYITGQTASVDFPVSTAIQPECAVNSRGNCAGEAFVTKLSPSGSTFLYSTYLGGSGIDAGNAIAADEDGDAYIAGVTSSRDFPLAQPLQAASAGQGDAFVTKIAPDGSKLVFSTYVGGSGEDEASAIAIDSSHDVFISGFTQSSNFPMQRPFQASCRRGSQGLCSVDAFVTVLDPTGSHLRLSSYLGGTGVDVSQAIAVDARGGIYSGGWTSSTDFPQAHSPQFSVRGAPLTGTEVAGGSFVAKINGIAPPPTVTCSSGTNKNYWVGTAGNNQWTTATNWSTGAVPISTDNVCIASSFTATLTVGSLAAANQTIASLTSGAPISLTTGPLTVTGTAAFSADLNITGATLTLNGTSTMTTLEFSSGTLTGTAGLTVSGLFTWSGGTHSGTGTTTVNGGMTISGEPFLVTRTMNNVGTATWSGVAFFMDGSTFNNQTGATWNDTVDAAIDSNGGTPVFNNSGTFEKTGGTTSTGGGVGSGVVFNNMSGGVVEANEGILFFNDLGNCAPTFTTCAGSWSVLTGDTLELGSAATGALSGPISGAGAVNFTTGTVGLTGTYNVTGGTTASEGTANFTKPVTSVGPLTISGGTLNFSTGAAVTTASLTQNSGTLAGSDALTVTGALTWSGGTESGTGTGTTTVNGGMTISGEPFLVTRTMNNVGTATWSGVAFFMDGSTFNNQTGATWNDTVDAAIDSNGGTPVFNNSGTFEKTGGTTSTGGGVGSGVVFNNMSGGVVEANKGILFFNDLGNCAPTFTTCAGSWSVLTGDTLELGSAATGALSGPISGAGAVNFTAGTVNLTGTYNVTGGTTASEGTANFTKPVTSVGPLTISGGTLNFSTGKTVTTKSLTQSTGTLTGSDALTVTGALTWSGGTESGTGSTTAKGEMTISGEPFLVARTMNNVKTATYSGVAFFMDGSTFNNEAGGIWKHTVDTSIENNGGSPIFNNAGTFEKTLGTTSGGVGSSIAFNNTGTVISESGTLSAGGTYTQGSAATLQVNISSTGVDLVDTSAAAALGGTLDICLTGAYNPAIGTVFTVMDYASHTGTFSTVESGTDTAAWTLAYNSTSLAATYAGSPILKLPTSVSFPSQLINTTGAAQSVKVTNSGTKALSISGITLGGTDAAEFAIMSNGCGASLAAGASCTVKVKFTPTALGKQSADLEIADNACGSPQAVPLSGKGTEITLSPSPASFGKVAVGSTSAPVTVTLTNNGTTSVTIDTVTITGTDATDFAITGNLCASAVVAGGGTCTMTLTFAPGATGSRTGTLNVTDTDSGSPQTDTLKGTGTT